MEITINGHKFEVYKFGKSQAMIYCKSPDKRRICLGVYESHHDAVDFILCFVSNELGFQLDQSLVHNLQKPA